MLFLEYPKCTTCIKAKKFLDDSHIKYTDRHIKDDRPTKEELREWLAKSGLPIKKLFNTSGLLYKELNLKDKLDLMSEDEKLEMLASNGMLVKRPILVLDNLVLFGFKEEEWKKNLLGE